MNPAPDTPAQGSMAGLYGEVRVALLSFLRKHTGDARAAEDLLHDVVVKALAAGRDETTAPQNLTGWLYAVARNAAIDYHRQRRPTEELPEDLTATPDQDDAALIELSNCLRPMAERLPSIYRETLLAGEFGGTPLKAIAEQEGVSLSAVKTRASRGRQLLQAELVSCCKVLLSESGKVLDYDPKAAATCAPSPGTACESPAKACRS